MCPTTKAPLTFLCENVCRLLTRLQRLIDDLTDSSSFLHNGCFTGDRDAPDWHSKNGLIRVNCDVNERRLRSFGKLKRFGDSPILHIFPEPVCLLFESWIAFAKRPTGTASLVDAAIASNSGRKACRARRRSCEETVF